MIEYTDSRGTIYKSDGGKNLLYTKAGVFRSGDVHPNIQFDSVIDGCVYVTTREDNTDITTRYVSGDRFIILADIPHLFYFEEDSWLIEWWDGPFSCEYYEPYRLIVESHMKELKNA